MAKGWKLESVRHSLARKGIKTSSSKRLVLKTKSIEKSDAAKDKLEREGKLWDSKQDLFTGEISVYELKEKEPRNKYRVEYLDKKGKIVDADEYQFYDGAKADAPTFARGRKWRIARI